MDIFQLRIGLYKVIKKNGETVFDVRKRFEKCQLLALKL